MSPALRVSGSDRSRRTGGEVQQRTFTAPRCAVPISPSSRMPIPRIPTKGSASASPGRLRSARREALARIDQVGGLPVDIVNHATDILVIGEQDGAKLRPGMTVSTKQEKAQSLRKQGQVIELLIEQEFRRTLDQTGSEGERLH